MIFYFWDLLLIYVVTEYGLHRILISCYELDYYISILILLVSAKVKWYFWREGVNFSPRILAFVIKKVPYIYKVEFMWKFFILLSMSILLGKLTFCRLLINLLAITWGTAYLSSLLLCLVHYQFSLSWAMDETMGWDINIRR